MLDLFNLSEGCEGRDEKPRDAVAHEIEAYLRWIATRAGLPHLPMKLVSTEYRRGGPDAMVRGAQFGNGMDDGAYCVALPGFGQRRTVIVETLDDAGEVVRTVTIGTDAKGKLGIDAKAVKALTGLSAVRKPRATVRKSPVVAQEAISAPATPPIAPKAEIAPTGDLAAILARLARLEAAAGLVERPKRSAAHVAAILRAWSMRKAMRERADLDRRALDYANGVNASLRDQLEEKRGQLVAVEAARAAAVHRAQCDENRAIDAETEIVAMTRRHDEAIAEAAAQASHAAGADRAATKIRRDLAAASERADRLARVAIGMRRKVEHAQADVRRANLDVVTVKASERRALKSLSALRSAIDASPTVAKIIDRATARAA